MLGNRDDLDEAQRKEVANLNTKLRKAKTDYKDKAKKMQQKIAAGLFGEGENKKSKPAPAAALPRETSTMPSPPTPSDAATNDAAKDIANIEKPQKRSVDAVIDGYEAGTATASKPSTAATSLNPNMIVLLGTSIAVVVISVLVAAFYRR